MTRSSVRLKVLNVSPAVDEAVLRNFFSFCGGIKSIEFNSQDLGPGELASAAKAAGAPSPASDAEAALVTFDSEDAAATAQLLSNSLLDDRPVLVIPAGSAKGQEEGDIGSSRGGDGASDADPMSQANPKGRGLMQVLRERAKTAQDQVQNLQSSGSIQSKVSEARQSAKDTASKLMSGETLRAGYGMLMSGLTSIKEAVKKAEEANRRFNERLLKEAHAEREGRRLGQGSSPEAGTDQVAEPAAGEQRVPADAEESAQQGSVLARVHSEAVQDLPRAVDKSS